MPAVLFVVAVVLFVLAALGVTVAGQNERDLVAWAGAAFALAHVAPAGFGRG